MTFIAIPVIIFFVLSVVTAYAAIGLVIFFLIREGYTTVIKTIESVLKK